MHHLKAINEKIQTLNRQAEAQGLPLNVGQVAALCIEYSQALTDLLDQSGLLLDPAQAKPAPGA